METARSGTTLRPITLGTRGSALAQWQTNTVLDALKRLDPNLRVETRVIKTAGDKDQIRPLAELGGLGVFTKEIEQALLTHEIDLAVHSLKDLPTENTPGLTILAITRREDPRDCLVSRHGVSLRELPHGARVGTSSARRSAQLLMLRPDLKMVPLRGNVDTRLRKAQTEEYDAVVLAAAGVIRLGRAAEITEYLDLDLLLPDPGQAALAVQARTDDPALAKLVARLDDAPTRAAVTAERALLRALGGGCRMPLGAYADVREQMLHLRGLIASVDGTRAVRDEVTGPWDAPEELGARLAEKLLRAGGREVLRQSVLIGKRILITRAQEQSADFATKIKAYGGVPVEFPTIRFEPVKDPATLDNALARINEFEWVVFTSANGVRAAAQRQGAVAWLPRAAQSRIAAIGPATARELGQLGLHVDFVPSRYLGEQIAMELPARPGEKALLLRADLASDALAEGLRARGVQVTDVDAYRTLHEESAPVDWGHIDAVTFTSSSTVRNWVEMSGEHGRRVLDHATVFCIGPVTAESARSLGIRVDAVAQEHTVDGLVETIVNYYEGNRNDA